MYKKELVDAVAERTLLSKKQAQAVVDGFVDTITDQLARHGNVSLIGFGRFEVRQREATSGRNPSTGAPIQIPARSIPAFKAGAHLRDSVN